jgi:hypothetical protein
MNLSVDYSPEMILLSILLSYIGSIFGISLAEQYRQNTIHRRELKDLEQLTQKHQDQSISSSGVPNDVESNSSKEIPVSKKSFFNSYTKEWTMIVSN